MQKRIINLTKKLITICSTAENPKALKEVLIVAKRELEDFRIEKFNKDNTPSLLIYNTKTPNKNFKIILNVHLDVVSAEKKQFKPFVKNGKLYGRGAYDMKAAGAVMILLFKKLADKLNYPLGLQLVVDEEIGGFNGTKYQIEQGVKSDFVIAGEPTDFGINNKAKGIIWAKIEAKGRSAHGAYPWQGNNAIWRIKKFLDKLEKKYPVPKREVWRTTVNLSKIETSNKTFNKVPENCIVSLDIRYIPKEKDKIIENIKNIVPEDLKVKFLLKEPAQFTDKKNKFIKALRESARKVIGKEVPAIVKHGGSDIRHYNRAGCCGITFGPKGYGLHADNEYVYIESLKYYYQILEDFLISINLDISKDSI